jgi:hypothetical protein
MTAVKVKLGSAAFVEAANSGSSIGLDEDGHVVEFMADRETLRAALTGEYLDVEDRQVLTVDDEVRVALNREAMTARAAFLRETLRR